MIINYQLMTRVCVCVCVCVFSEYVKFEQKS
jgi:hypothetical protein